MIGGRTLWLIGAAGLMLLLAGLGCSICPLVPRPGPTPPWDEVTLPPKPTAVPTLPPTSEPTAVPTLPLTSEPTAMPTLVPTREPLSGMSLYTNPLAGFSILYPADWTYEAEDAGAYFAETEEALAYSDPAEVPILTVMTSSPEEVERQIGPAATAEDLLDSVLEDLREEEGSEIGDVEAWTFGEVPGAGTEVSWIEGQVETQIHGYVIAALGEGVAGIGFGASPEADWFSYEPIFRDMLASLEFFPPEVPEPVERGPIQPGEAVQGTLPLGGTEVWYFDAQEGQYVTIRLDAVDPDALDPYLEFYNEDGLIIAEDDDGGEGANARIVDLPVIASGTYTIHALTYSGEGDYTLSLEVAGEPSASGTIEYSQTVEGMLTEDMEDGWFFQGSEGDVVTIAMNALGDELDCYLELYDPNGLALTDDDDSGEDLNALIEYYELPADGTYRIVAGGALFGVTGAYELTLERAEMVVEGTLTYGETVNAALEPGTRHHWLFEGEAGDVVAISMTALTGDMDTYLELFAPNGVRVIADDDGGGDANAKISTFKLPLSGTYRIIARGYGDDDVGEYELTLAGP